MNKRAFRLVFSKRLGMLVPVALGLSIVGLGSTSAQTTPLPTGGQVVQGAGSISQTANTLTVQQNTQLLGVNWQSFNIGAGNTVQFVQPNAQAVAINRVLGNDRSEIFGNLKANGQVFLLNPNGVLFGANAQVDVGALVASTARQASQGVDGSWTFSDKGTGQVVNQGHIKAKDGGFVVLDSAAQTINAGTIEANRGGVALTVVQNTRIALDAQGQLNVNVDGAVLQALVSNQGLILADGGAVHLTARGKNMLLNSVVNQTGVIKARSVQNRNGRIFLSGGDSGKVQVSGTLDVSGKEAVQTGGRIEVTGEHIQISQATLDASGHSAGGSVRIDAAATTGSTGSTRIESSTVSVNATAPIFNITPSANGITPPQATPSTAQAGRITVGGGLIAVTNSTLSASGPAGGGRIEVGGGYQGAAVEGLTTAQTTTVDETSLIDVSSTGAGNGGTAIVWSNQETNFKGQIDGRAKQAEIGGDGGFGEVSGKLRLIYEGKANMLAANTRRRTGDLLLDPYNLTISNNASSGMSGFDANANDSVLQVSALVSALGGANVTVTTGTAGNTGTQAGDITVANTISWNADTRLTLTAAGKVNVNAAISNSSTGSNAGLTLISNGTGAAGGVTGAGNIAVRSLTVNVADSGASGTLSGVIADPSGTTATLTKSGAGTLTLTGTNTYTGGTTVSQGTLDVKANAAAAGATMGAITLGDANSGSNNITLVVDGNLNYARSGVLTISAAGSGVKTVHSQNSTPGGIGLHWSGGIVFNGAATMRYTNQADAYRNGSTWSGAGHVTIEGDTAFTYLGGDKSAFSGGITANLFGVDFRGSYGGALTVGSSGAVWLVVNESFSSINGSGTIAALGRFSTTAKTLTVQSGTFSGVLSNDNGTFGQGSIGATPLALVKSGSGTLTLSGASTYTGATTVSAGTLQLGNGGSTGSIAGTSIVIGNGATLAVNRSGGTALTMAHVISGTGGNLVKNGSDTLILTEANTYTGTTTVNAGTLQVGSGSTSGSIANSAVTTNANFVVNRSDAITLASLVGGSSITGSGNIRLQSNGAVNVNRTINLSGASSNITLLAGNATPAGTASGGEVMLTNTITTSDTGTVSIFSGNANTSTLDGQITGATGGKNKSYSSAAAATSGAVSGARNLFYRESPSASLILSGVSVSAKTYDGTASATLTGGNITGSFDNLTANAPTTGTFNSANVATANVVAFTIPTTTSSSDGYTVVSGFSLGGQTTQNASISARTVGLSASKTYDGTTGLTGSQVTITTGVGLETLSYSNATVNDKNVATTGKFIDAITLGDGSNGGLASNYALPTLDNSNAAVTITPAALTVAGNTASAVYTAGAQTNGFTTTGLLGSDSVSGVTGLASGTTVGTYTDNLSAAVGTGLGNYTISYTNGSLQITPAALTVAGNTASAVYTAGAQTNGFTTTGLLGSDSVSGVTGLASGTTVGTYTDNLSAAVGTGLGNYTISYTNGSLQITPAALTVAGNTASAVYTAGAQTNGFTTTGLLGSDSVSGVTGLASGTTVGTYTDNLSAAVGTGLGNYTISYTNGSLQITPAALTVAGNTASAVYTAGAQTNGFTTTGLLGSDSVSGVTGLASGTTVGTYTDNLSAAVGTGLGNYTISYTNGSLQITPAALTVAGNTASAVYTAGAQTNGFTTTGLLGSDSVSGVTGLASGTTVGTYTDNLSAAVGTGLGNYTISYTNGSLQITPAALTVAGNTASAVYTAGAQTNGFTTTGLLGSDSVSGVTGLASGTTVGTYTDNLSAAVGTGLGNYTISYTNGSLQITPEPTTTATSTDITTAISQATSTFASLPILADLIGSSVQSTSGVSPGLATVNNTNRSESVSPLTFLTTTTAGFGNAQSAGATDSIGEQIGLFNWDLRKR